MGEVVQIKPRDQVKARKASRKQRKCNHRNVIADESLRSLQCQDCGKWLDAFDWVFSVACEEFEWRQEAQKMAVLCKEHELQLQALQGELSSLMDQLVHFRAAVVPESRVNDEV